MKRQSKEKRNSISRRQALRHGVAAGTLPLTLLISSQADAVIASEAEMRPFTDRVKQFKEDLRSRLAEQQQQRQQSNSGIKGSTQHNESATKKSGTPQPVNPKLKNNFPTTTQESETGQVR